MSKALSTNIPSTLPQLTGNLRDTFDGLHQWIDTVVAKNDPVKFEEEVTQLAANFSEMQSWSVMAEACMLHKVYSLWEDSDLPPEVTSEYDGNFINWAIKVGRSGAQEPNKQTIMNKVKLYDYYFAGRTDGFVVPPTLFDEEGNEYKNVDLTEAAFNKLETAKGLAGRKGGNLDDVTILAMVDPTITAKKFRDIIAAERAELNGGVEKNTQSKRGKVKRTKEEIAAGKTIEEKAAEVEAVSASPDIEVIQPEPTKQKNQLSLDGLWVDDNVLRYTSPDNVTYTLCSFEVTDFENSFIYNLVETVLQRLGVPMNALLSAKGIEPSPIIEGPRFSLTEDDTLLVNLNGYTLHEYPGEVIDDFISELEELR